MLTWVIIFAFLAFPPGLLAVKFFTKKPSGWLLVLLVVIYALLVWAQLFFAFVEDKMHSYELIRQGKDEELPSGWDNDAAGVGALFFGWLYPLVYYLLWLAVYYLAGDIRRLFTSKISPNMEPAIYSAWSTAVVITRWLVFAHVFLAQLGAFTQGKYVAGVTGLVFCLFLTVHQRKVVAYTKLPYVLVFALMAILFITGLYIDMQHV